MLKESRLLKSKAIASMRRAMQAFNALDDDGRTTAVLLHSHHGCEMLLKASLRAKGVTIFDKKSGRSIGFDKCLNLAGEKLQLPATSLAGC